MLSGVLFQKSTSNPDDVTPQFVNQYILTDLCISSVENAGLQTPILPSIATLVNPMSSLIVILFRIFRSIFLVILSHLPGSQQVIRRISVANTGIYFHDGRALATCESGPPIRVQLPGLDTVGWYNGKCAEGEMQASKGTQKKEEKFGGTGFLSFQREWTTGHPKIDPRTSEMILFHCNYVAPYVHYSVVPPDQSVPSLSKVLNAPVPGCSGGKMMHDFGVSRAHTVILDLPLSLTPFNLLKNQPILRYEPTKPARFGVFPRRDPSQVKWFETTGCCIFHTANTWDEYNLAREAIAVNMLVCRLTSASLVFSAGNLTPPPHPRRRAPIKRRLMSFFTNTDADQGVDVEKLLPNENTPLLKPENTTVKTDNEQCRLYYYRFSILNGQPVITHQYALSSIPLEFPTLNPTYEMSFARYIYGCSTSNESFGAALGKATKIDVLVKMDVQELLAHGQAFPPRSITGCVDSRNISHILATDDDEDPIRTFRMPPNYYAQEARFVSRACPASEDDGYLLFYAFNESQIDDSGECRPDAISELWIIDAKNMRDVVAKVQLPQRVPYGLHGNWFTEKQIGSQRSIERVRTLPRESRDSIGKKVKRALISALR